METNFYLAVAIIWAVAAVTPGPNFFITVRTAVSGTGRQSIYTVLGIVVGTLFWTIAGYFGITMLFKTAPALYYGLKIAGGMYLIYLGARLLLKKKESLKPVHGSLSLSSLRFFRLGLLTNLLNPKTAAFMTSLFAVAIPPDHTVATGLFSAIIICSISALWYSIVAVAFTRKKARAVYENWKKSIERVAGCIFIFFGLRLALSD